MSESITHPLSEATAGTGTTGRGRKGANLRPLLLDLAVPLGGYYLLRDAFGLSLVLSLALSSVVPAIRTVFSLVKERDVNPLAALMLAVNAAGIALTFLTGDPRLMLAKDSGISSVVGVTILISAFAGKPLMSAGLKPWLTKENAARRTAWDRLSAGSRRFRRLERRFSLIWGSVLLTECVLRVVGAFTLPVSTMVWLGTVLTVVAIGLAILLGGVATVPMDRMLAAEAAGGS